MLVVLKSNRIRHSKAGINTRYIQGMQQLIQTSKHESIRTHNEKFTPRFERKKQEGKGSRVEEGKNLIVTILLKVLFLNSRAEVKRGVIYQICRVLSQI